MFYLIDLKTGTARAFETRLELADTWARMFPEYRRFEQLNITGSDTYAYHTTDGYGRIPDGNGGTVLIPFRKLVYGTRRYLVLDEDNKHIDIRTWGSGIWDNVPTRHTYRRTRFYSGAKRHSHRISGPSGYRRTMRAMSDTGLLEDIDTCQHENSLKPRPKTRIRGVAVYDWYEEKACRPYNSSKCWKDQCKSRRQYKKHTWDNSRQDTYVPEDGEELAARLMEELCG